MFINYQRILLLQDDLVVRFVQKFRISLFHRDYPKWYTLKIVITEFDDDGEGGLYSDDFDPLADAMGVSSSNARVARSVPAVFLQPSLYLFESHSRSRHSHLLQRADATDSSADQFLQGVHATVGEQWTDVLAAAVSHEHRYRTNSYYNIRRTKIFDRSADVA